MPLESVTDRKQGRMPLSQHTTEGGIAIGNLGQLRVGSLSLNSERLTHDNQTHKRLKWVITLPRYLIYSGAFHSSNKNAHVLHESTPLPLFEYWGSQSGVPLDIHGTGGKEDRQSQGKFHPGQKEI